MLLRALGVAAVAVGERERVVGDAGVGLEGEHTLEGLDRRRRVAALGGYLAEPEPSRRRVRLQLEDAAEQTLGVVEATLVQCQLAEPHQGRGIAGRQLEGSLEISPRRVETSRRLFEDALVVGPAVSARLDAARVGVGGERRLGLAVRVIELPELAVCLRQPVGIQVASALEGADQLVHQLAVRLDPKPHRLGHRLEIGIDQRRVVARRFVRAGRRPRDRDHDDEEESEAEPGARSPRGARAGGRAPERSR